MSQRNSSQVGFALALFMVMGGWLHFSFAESTSSALKGVNLSPKNVWPQFSKPSGHSSESVGSYSSGCLQGAKELIPEDGQALQRLRPERNTYFGHPNLLEFLKKLSESEDLNVGDMSQPRGGPMPGGHASHQNGLDVDIFYHETPKDSPTSVVSKDGLELKDSQWKASFEELLLQAARFERVERIFVNAVVKRKLCQKYPDFENLAKIRPWYFHQSHFHVRLECPEKSKNCQPQKPVPDDPQCGEKLDWWLSKEARKVWIDRSDEPARREFSLPMDCADLAHQGS